MIDYLNFDVEDFAKDEAFRKWVMDESPEEAIFWGNWLEKYPGKKEIVDQSIVLVLSVKQRYEDDLSQEEVDHEVARLMHRVEAQAIEPIESASNRKPFVRRHWWQIAASLLLLVGLGWGYRQFRLTSDSSSYDRLVSKASENLIERVNLTNHRMVVRLSDSSTVILEKNSRISFSFPFQSDQRNVYLDGEAFFTVTKNPQRPFLVYANETVTKVLGTSFKVSAYEKAIHVTVAVKTGRVSFYTAKEFEKTRTTYQSQVHGVVLTPNQQGVFNRNDGRLDKGLVEKPEVLALETINKELVFEDRPVSEVLKTLERSYGINIVFDEELLAHCPITTSFREESLQQRLSVICQAIGATYEVIDGKIVVNGKPCKTESISK